MADDRVPFNRAKTFGSELAYVTEAVAGGHTMGDGPFTRKCERLLESMTGAARAFLTTSCTHALEMAGLLLNLSPGDEVIVPSFTFVSTANAFALRGATIAFADSRADTLNLDETKLEALFTDRTRAVCVMHYAGIACEMDAIRAVCDPRGIAVVEDNAHGLFGTYNGRSLGTLGALGTQSFHETKNVTCGEGGALLVGDPALAARAEILREKGTNRSAFFRGEVDKYSWVDVGSSYVPSDMLAAFLLAQLEQREAIQAARRRVWEVYADELAAWAEKTGARLPVVPDHCGQTYHTFFLLAANADDRDGLIAHLRERGVASAFHYLPLHLSTVGRRMGGRPGDCPVAEDAADRLIRLPLFVDLTGSEQARVIDAVRSYPDT